MTNLDSNKALSLKALPIGCYGRVIGSHGGVISVSVYRSESKKCSGKGTLTRIYISDNMMNKIKNNNYTFVDLSAGRKMMMKPILRKESSKGTYTTHHRLPIDASSSNNPICSKLRSP